MSIENAPTVLIVYPREFLCLEKFERKLKGILSGLSEFNVAFHDDYNMFLEKYLFSEVRTRQKIKGSLEEVIVRATHAVIFDDGRVYKNLIERVKQRGIHLRVVNVAITRVANIDRGDSYDIYIGRGSVWGNPYAIGVDGDRNEVVRKFQYEFERGFLKFSKDDATKLIGKTLGCHCRPAACHGDIIAQYLNAFDNGD